MATMIALVGGQPLPNYIPVRAVEPEKVLFVYTDQTERVYKRLEAVLVPQGVAVEGLQTSAYDMPQVTKDVREWIDQRGVAGSDLVVNFTGGTKPMSLAVYRVAADLSAPLVYLESERKQSKFYRYVWDGGFRLDNSEILPELITLKDFFNLYLGINAWSEAGPSSETGGKLEKAIADTLCRAGYEVMCGVRAKNNQVDIDVAVRFENQVGIIEAKSGNVGRKLDAVKQLNNAARLLSLYTQVISVVTVEPDERHNELREAYGIKLVRLCEYSADTQTKLSDEDEKLLCKAVEEMLKG